ncbi:hypothetical protein TKK_0005981 [Trichogramma kaykai]
MNLIRLATVQSRRIPRNGWAMHKFHTHSMKCAEFNEKPKWFKKFKLKQAAMQRDDGDIPVFLKKGLRDKILYNFTLFTTIFGFVWAMKTIIGFDNIKNDEEGG